MRIRIFNMHSLDERRSRFRKPIIESHRSLDRVSGGAIGNRLRLSIAAVGSLTAVIADHDVL